MPSPETQTGAPAPTDAIKDRRVIEALLEDLATLDSIDYALRRKQEASRIGFPLGILDKEVAQRRPQPDHDDDIAGSSLLFPEIEPWPDPVDGAELLDSIVAAIGEHVVTPKGGAETAALWLLFAHTHGAHLVSPILAILAPEKECGKTVLLETISWLVPSPLPSSSNSPAVIYHVIEEHSPVLLTDEMDTLPKETLEAIRGIYNAAHTRRFAKVMRMVPVGDGMKARSFSSWAPKAMAQIGRPPETMLGRSIVIEMSRKQPGEPVKRLPPDGTAALLELARKCVRWSADNAGRLAGVVPKFPHGMGNRPADNWMPLFNIADLIGGPWPERAREIARQQSTEADAVSLGIELLEDIAVIFKERGATKLSSDFICAELHKLEHRKWPEYERAQKPITKVQLANLLKRYRIKPKSLRPDPGGISGEPARGYDIADFKASFASYLPHQGVTPLQPTVSAGYSGFQGVTENEPVTPSDGRKPAVSLACNGVTPPEGGSDENPEIPGPREPHQESDPFGDDLVPGPDGDLGAEFAQQEARAPEDDDLGLGDLDAEPWAGEL